MSKFWSKAARDSKPYIPGEQLNRQDIIKLNTNENPYPPSRGAVEAIREAAADRLNLYPTPTADELRETIGTYHGLTKDHVFVGNGSDEVLAFSFMAFFEKGTKVRYPEISYSFYPVYANLFEVIPDTVPLNDDFTLPVEAFFQAEGGVIFPNPNAPTSVYLELDQVEEILKNNPETVVIIDEAYVDFAKASAVSLVESYENLLVTQTLSKSRSLAGLRVGYAIGQPQLIEGLMRIKDSFNSYTIDRLALAGATVAMKDEAYLQETTEKIIATRDRITAEMKQRGFKVLPSQANFLFVTHPHKNAATLYQQLKKNGVLVRHWDKENIRDYLRITIGTEEQMEAFLEKLDQL